MADGPAVYRRGQLDILTPDACPLLCGLFDSKDAGSARSITPFPYGVTVSGVVVHRLLFVSSISVTVLFASTMTQTK